MSSSGFVPGTFSKRFAKELMLRAGVPTARAEIHTDSAKAKRAYSRYLELAPKGGAAEDVRSILKGL